MSKGHHYWLLPVRGGETVVDIESTYCDWNFIQRDLEKCSLKNDIWKKTGVGESATNLNLIQLPVYGI